jgi:DNA-binding transcriptional ArsR family regulator
MKLYHINQEKLETAASKLKAISHPVRIAILELLSKEKMCVTDIYEQLGLGHNHLKQSLHAGNRAIYYSAC